MAEQETPNKPAAAPRDAATVVVVRKAESGIELFCVQRHLSSGTLGGAIVFPGGKVDSADWDDSWAELCAAVRPRACALAGDERAGRAFAVAGLRELLEEAAILPTSGQTLTHEAASELRRLLDRKTPAQGEARAFSEILRSRELCLAASELEGIWRWVTPVAEARRYDTRFYLMTLPEGQLGQHDERETTHSFWATPEQILERWDRAEIVLAPPTLCTIGLFKEARTVAEAFAIAARQTLEPIRPFLAFEGERAIIAMPGDPLYPESCSAALDPRGPTRFVWENGRFVGKR
jgi:8-oxo-dGTP pyrophosphatase MutT (NUDIX family)